MTKRPKYKRGYTWRHDLDEKWDRLNYAAKIKIKGFLFIFFVGAIFLEAIWALQKQEKEEFLRGQEGRNEASRTNLWLNAQKSLSPPPLRPGED